MIISLQSITEIRILEYLFGAVASMEVSWLHPSGEIYRLVVLNI